MKVSLEQVHERWAHRLKPYEHALSAMQEDVDKVEERIILIAPADAGRAALFEIRQFEGARTGQPSQPATAMSSVSLYLRLLVK